MANQNPVLSLVFGVHGVEIRQSLEGAKADGTAATFFPAALPYAQQAHVATGVDIAVILAQWADEQGYQWPPMFDNPGNVGDPASAGQQGYPTVEAGVQAYIQTMLLGYYVGVREAVGDTAQAYALGQSPWAGGHYDANGGPPGTDLVKIIAEFNLSQYNTSPNPVPAPTPPAPSLDDILKDVSGKIGNLNAPVVTIVPSTTGDGLGYTEVGSDGGTFNYGDADFYGSLAGIKLNAPIISAKRPIGPEGLYMVATDGGVFTFGGAVFYGSAGSLKLNAPIVDIAVTPTGKGYWLVAADGGIFTFGDAPFLGTPA